MLGSQDPAHCDKCSRAGEAKARRLGSNSPGSPIPRRINAYAPAKHLSSTQRVFLYALPSAGFSYYTLMELAKDAVAINKLNGLLLDAMNQSRALFSQLEQQAQTITCLKRENELLQHELEDLRTGQADCPHRHAGSAQLEHLFQQNAEKQAEIERLRTKLRAARKDRLRPHCGDTQLASPIASSDGVEHIFASHLPGAATPGADDLRSRSWKRRGEEMPLPVSSTVQKRRRTETQDGVLLELSPNTVNSFPRRDDGKGRDRSIRGVKAISSVTEDGEDHNRKENEDATTEVMAEHRQPGVHQRLDALLSATSSAHSALVRQERRPTRSVSPRTPVQNLPSFTKSSSDVCSTLKAQRPSGLRFLRPGRHWGNTAEDSEPLRSRPLQQLNLSHFKLNPAYHGRHEPAFDGPVRNKEQKKCLPGCTRPECCGTHMRALAWTLGPDLKLSDDDLLLDFLGPGSDKKITALTSVARENLLHEARVKRVANEYGKMHRNGRERAMTPSGFWITEMPGSQETERHRDEASRWEREEIERRHQEACSEKGRWMFADE